jgi:acetoin utilization protein AcuC
MPSRAPLAIVWDPAFLDYDFGPNHPFQESSRGLAVDLFEATVPSGSAGALAWQRSVAPAGRSVLERFHRPDYLDFVDASCRANRPPALDGGDTPAFAGGFDAAARLVAGTVDALAAIADGRARRAFQPGGGLHHAHPERASGFCIFNDLAVAIAGAVGAGRPFARAAYLDIDAHHGDGVMYGFYEDGRLLDIDFHQDGRTLFPGTGGVEETGRGDGAGLKVNVPMPPGAGDETLVPTFRRLVPPLLRDFRPELIVLQHGMDGHAGDRLAGLRYGPQGYASVLRQTIELADEVCDGRLLVTGGGGYRAESVALGLARAGHQLAGRGSPSGPLPIAWRERFATVTGEAAPARWAEPVTAGPSEAGAAVSGMLVEALEAALGRRFPPDGAR